jgi:ElaB/YqjD/DUF883 family membrane-anchored ribosome-binding protein
MGHKDELADRVRARKHELLSKYNELKADSRRDSREAGEKIKAKLDELEDTIKDGWDNMSDAVRAKLNKWLDKSENENDRK